MNENAQLTQVADLFDKWADAGRAEGMEKGHEVAARKAFAKLEVGPSQHYLDIGCGNGYSVRWAAAIDPSVQAVGLDVSPKMVERARKASSAFNNVRFIHAPYPLELLKAETFDAIFSMEVFYYLPDLRFALASTRRLLKKGGRFACIVDFYEENEASHEWAEKMDVAMNLLSDAAWRAAFEQAGLEVVEQTRIRSSDPNAEAWKREEGSLLILGRRPQP